MTVTLDLDPEIEPVQVIEIPLSHLGVISPLRRGDIYDDIDDATRPLGIEIGTP